MGKKLGSPTTIPLNITNCDFLDNRLLDKTDDIARNIATVSEKLLKIPQVELAYKLFQIYIQI